MHVQAPAPQPAAEEVADMRARICAGMKRYFHTKQTEGLLSNRVRRTADPSPVPSCLRPPALACMVMHTARPHAQLRRDCRNQSAMTLS
jgi:hypothetical protein